MTSMIVVCIIEKIKEVVCLIGILSLDRGICKYAQPRERMVWSDCPGDARLFPLFAAPKTSRVKDKGAYCGE